MYRCGRRSLHRRCSRHKIQYHIRKSSALKSAQISFRCSISFGIMSSVSWSFAHHGASAFGSAAAGSGYTRTRKSRGIKGRRGISPPIPHPLIQKLRWKFRRNSRRQDRRRRACSILNNPAFREYSRSAVLLFRKGAAGTVPSFLLKRACRAVTGVIGGRSFRP